MRLTEVTTATPIDREPEGFWFRHQSPHWLTELRPLTYEELAEARPEYPISERQETEEVYHFITGQDQGTSFLYATVVGHHQMPDPLDYPGFTYYFKLDREQIEQCLFDIADHKVWMDPALGVAGLRQALSMWREHEDEMESYDDPDIGEISPRVEVVIPFAVEPQLYVPQIEDRASSEA